MNWRYCSVEWKTRKGIDMVLALQKEADRVVDKLIASSVKGFSLAVFVFPDGRIKTTRPTTDLFAEAMNRNPMALAGVYDSRAIPSRMAEDMQATMEAQGVYLRAA